jgi:Glycosyltransferase family 87
VRARVSAAQLAAAVLSVVFLAHKWPTVGAFVAVIDHGDVLFADFVHHYYPTVAQDLQSGLPAGGFFYPAGFAVMLAPIGLLPAGAAMVAWGLVQLACLVVLAGTLVREAAARRSGLAVLGTVIALTSVPVLHGIKWGQVSLPIVATVGAAFVLRARGREWPAAVLLAIAAGIKGYPLAFLGWFVLKGDFRFALRAAGACAVTLLVLPALVMGPSHALLFQRITTISVLGAAEGVLRDFNSQHATAVFARYEGGWDRTPADLRALVDLASFGVLALIGGLVVIAARSTSPRIAAHREMLGFVLIACTVPFWLHTSWSHYFAHLPVAQVLLARALAGERGPFTFTRGLGVLVFVAPSVFLSSVLALFETRGWWYYANAGTLFFANALVLLGCALFIGEAHATEGRGLFGAFSAFSARGGALRTR